MSRAFRTSRLRRCLTACVVAAPLAALGGAAPAPGVARESQDAATATPIKHVIVIIGENRSFDHVFATYVSPSGEHVDNLLAKGIVNADGTPGPNFGLATQFSAVDSAPAHYRLSPGGRDAYAVLPPAVAGGPSAPFVTAAELPFVQTQVEPNLDPAYYVYLTTGGTGQASGTPDQRVPNATLLRPGPWQLTSSTLPYDSYTASPVHRFYQMWQQMDCSSAHATPQNPSGCRADLFPWVEVTIGAGSNGRPLPANFTDLSTHEGSTSMAFYNVQSGDAPYLKQLADQYAISDNFHQSVMGGTGANHVMLGTGDAVWFSDGAGHPAQPPHNQPAGVGATYQGIVDEIENPDPLAGTDNWYTEDGYGKGGFGTTPASGGGTYSECADPDAPGVAAVRHYLASLPKPVAANCETGHYYLLNNYNPGYFGDGTNAYTDTNSNNYAFTIPPSTLRNIGDALLEKNISFAYFGDGFDLYLNDKYEANSTTTYCNICNFFQYSTSIMTNPAVRSAALKDTIDLYSEISAGTLPAVSYVKPGGLVDGHPASSKLNLFEGFVKKVVDAVRANPQLWSQTAILVTFDEGGGYYDSGYVQPVDFFGDGTRIPLIAVSPFTRAGHVSHAYTDHVSILKFIERNWGLAPLTARSRDNLPNPRQNAAHPYVPTNSPAIGDLFDLFNFH
jgi:phospholipase C